jgi:hypothetical protein
MQKQIPVCHELRAHKVSRANSDLHPDFDARAMSEAPVEDRSHVEMQMRILNILSGVAVLLNALHMAHFIQHFYVHAATATPLFWFGMAVAVIVDMLSIIGGVLLLRRNVTS